MRYRYDEGKLPVIICEEHPEWLEIYSTAWKMAVANIDYPDKPQWLPQMTCMPGVGIIWQWDSCFMALYARYSNRTVPVMNNLDNLYRLQRKDGYMSMAYRIAEEEDAYGERINPPLFAWVEWEYYKVTGDASRLESSLARLVRLYDWIKTNRRRQNGLYWFEDSGSSGMDNSPRSGFAAEKLCGSDVCFIDLASQQALSALYIARIAAHLGKTGIVSRFEEEHRDLSRLINEFHWCERFGFYFDIFNRTEEGARYNYLNHKTVAGFWPIISMVANEHQVDKLMEHLLSPDEFWTLHPVPSLARDDPNYDPFGGYWLGGVWAPTNYMIISGLDSRGRSGLAREIAVRHLDAMVAVMKNETYGGIWESYAPEYFRPSSIKDQHKDLVRPDFVGWSGLGPIMILIENILGFNFDASKNLIRWDIRTKGKHGVENLFFNGKTVSLVCEPRAPESNEIILSVETTGKIELKVTTRGEKERTYTLPSGKQQIVFPSTQ